MITIFQHPLVDNLNLLPYEWWDLHICTIACHILAQVFLCQRVSKIGIHIHLSVKKWKIASHWSKLKISCTFTLIANSYKNNLVLPPLLGIKKHMLFEDYMFDVDKSLNIGNTLKENLLLSNEDEDRHDSFKFPNENWKIMDPTI